MVTRISVSEVFKAYRRDIFVSLVIILVFFLAGQIVSMYSPKVFKSSAVIKIGKVFTPLTSIQEITQKVESRAFLRQFEEQGILLGQIKAVALSDPRFIELVVTGPDAHAAATLSNAVAQYLVTEGSRFYAVEYKLLREAVDDLRRKSRKTEDALDVAQKRLGSGQNDSGILYANLAQFPEQIFEYEKTLLLASDFAVIDPAQVPKTPVRPQPRVIALFSLNIGIAAAVAFFLLKRYWA